MSEVKTSLEKVHVKNYIVSLRDVELPLKPWTILVGPNASGKSNVLNALSLLNQMMHHEKPPPVKLIRDSLWAGEANHITFQMQAKVEETPTVYVLALNAEADHPFVTERLSVNSVDVPYIHSERRGRSQGRRWRERDGIQAVNLSPRGL